MCRTRSQKQLIQNELIGTPRTVAHQAPLSMGFSRQEYWSRLPFPSPGDLPDPGIEPRSTTLQADALTSEPPGLVHISKMFQILKFVCRSYSKCRCNMNIVLYAIDKEQNFFLLRLACFISGWPKV